MKIFTSRLLLWGLFISNIPSFCFKTPEEFLSVLEMIILFSWGNTNILYCILHSNIDGVPPVSDEVACILPIMTVGRFPPFFPVQSRPYVFFSIWETIGPPFLMECFRWVYFLAWGAASHHFMEENLQVGKYSYSGRRFSPVFYWKVLMGFLRTVREVRLLSYKKAHDASQCYVKWVNPSCCRNLLSVFIFVRDEKRVQYIALCWSW